MQDANGDDFVWAVENSSDEISSFCDASIENEFLFGLITGNNNFDNEMIASMSYNQSKSNGMLKVDNLNPDVGKAQVMFSNALKPEDIKQIGVDEGKKALSDFKSVNINVKKDYKNFYIFTSIYNVKIKGLKTGKTIDGIIRVFGPKISENIYLIHTSLWKDLIFYFVCVNSADDNDFKSYSLKNMPSEDKLVANAK